MHRSQAAEERTRRLAKTQRARLGVDAAAPYYEKLHAEVGTRIKSMSSSAFYVLTPHVEYRFR
jgi:hypothetical protein